MLCTRNLGYKILPFMDRICLPTIGPHVSLFTLQRFNNNLARNKLTYVACIDEYINAEAYIHIYVHILHTYTYKHACIPTSKYITIPYIFTWIVTLIKQGLFKQKQAWKGLMTNALAACCNAPTRLEAAACGISKFGEARR
jgi:hypothetical protein